MIYFAILDVFETTYSRLNVGTRMGNHSYRVVSTDRCIIIKDGNRSYVSPARRYPLELSLHGTLPMGLHLMIQREGL
jgi:hypothetical protein